MSKNEFLIEKYDKLRVDIKMYMCEISKFRISDLKAQKMIFLWTMKHVSCYKETPCIMLVDIWLKIAMLVSSTYKPIVATVSGL